MLETIREYATEKLEQSDEAVCATERLAEWAGELADSVAPAAFGHVDRTNLDRVDREHANVRAAVESALGQGNCSLVLRLGRGLWPLWLMRGRTVEGLGWLTRALAAPNLAADERSHGVLAAGELARFSGQLDLAVTFKHETLDLERHGAGEAWYGPAVLADLCEIETARGNHERAREYGEESLRRSQSDVSQARAFSSVGELALEEGDLGRAERFFERAVRLAEDSGHARNHASSVEGLAEATRRRGDVARASALFCEGLSRFAELGDQGAAADCLEGLAMIAHDGGRSERAGRLWGAARALRESSGVAATRQREPLELPGSALLEGTAMSFEEALAYALEDVT
jgi:non-specific serine/threonine protein kinase